MKTIYKSQRGKKEVLGFYNEFLKNAPKNFGKSYIPTNYGDTFCVSGGHSSLPPMVLLHGTGSNSAMWMADLELLAKDYSVYALDIVGECGNSSENRYSFKDKSYSGWLREVIVALNIEDPVLVGCSLGGWIALDYTVRYPGQVSKLVLLAPAGLVNIKLSMIFWILMTSLMGDFGFRKINQKVYGNLEIDTTALQFASLVRQHYIPLTEALPLKTDEELSGIKIPVLYFGGEHDCFYSSEMAAERLKNLLPHVVAIVLKNRGHVLINLTGDILNFLKNS